MTSKIKRQSIAGFVTLCFDVLLFCAAAAIAAQAQTFTPLVNFDGTNGTTPDTPLVQRGPRRRLGNKVAAAGTNVNRLKTRVHRQASTNLSSAGCAAS